MSVHVLRKHGGGTLGVTHTRTLQRRPVIALHGKAGNGLLRKRHVISASFGICNGPKALEHVVMKRRYGLLGLPLAIRLRKIMKK